MTSSHSATIAIVDDEASVRTALSRLFRSSGYEACTFASGQEFLSTLPDCHYDCLVIDLQMPVMSGLDVQLAGAFRKAPLPTIIITANDEHDMRQRCLTAGTWAFLAKPFEDAELLDLVVDAMNSWPDAQ